MQKKAFLTIDDSPTKDFIAKLDCLEKYTIPAVLFCIGNLLEEHSDMAIQGIKRGFPIANHSYSHPHFSSITVDQCKWEISKTDEIIEALYSEAGVQRPAKWFRFPYGDKGDKKNGKVFSRFKRGNSIRKVEIQNHLKALGYSQPPFQSVKYQYMQKAKLYDDIDWSWTFDIMEWAMQENKPSLGLKNLDKIFARLKKKKPRDCRGFLGFEKRWLASDSAEVILLHDHEGTSVHFESIIRALTELPLQFESVKPEAEN